MAIRYLVLRHAIVVLLVTTLGARALLAQGDVTPPALPPHPAAVVRQHPSQPANALFAPAPHAYSVAAQRHRNAIIGTAIGAAVGLVAGIAYARAHSPACEPTPGGRCAYGPNHSRLYESGGLVVGALLGAAVGHKYPQTATDRHRDLAP